MSDNSIEKSFLYLLAFSLLLHVGVGALLYYLPETKRPLPKEPVFIDLQSIPIPEKMEIVRPKVEKPIELPKKTQNEEIEKIRPQETLPGKNYYVMPKGGGKQSDLGKTDQNKSEKSANQPKQAEPEPSAFGLLKQKKPQIEKKSLDDLLIKKSTSSKIEEQIKNRLQSGGKSAGFGVGDDFDLSLVSFYSRFLTEANSRLKPPLETTNQYINVKGKLEVTFNRKGEIIDIDVTKSGGKIYDDAAIEALKKSVIGPLPKTFKHETTTLPLEYLFLRIPRDTR